MSDLWTMIWKEIRDEILQGGRSSFIRPLLIVGIMGILLPLQLGLHWLAFSPAVILVTVYVSFFFINYLYWGCHRRRTRAAYARNAPGQPRL